MWKHLKPALITAAIALLVVVVITWWHDDENALKKAPTRVAG